MAGTMRFLDRTGRIVSPAMAMGLTTDPTGVDHIGGNIIYATDTQRLFKLAYVNGTLNVVSNVNVTSQVSATPIAVMAMCSNPSGHWILINETFQSGPAISTRAKIHRFDLDGNYIFTLPTWTLSTQFVTGVQDMTHDDAFLYACWTESSFPTNTQYARKMYYRDGRAIRQTNTTANTVAYSSMAWNGKDFYTTKSNNFNLAIHDLRHRQINNNGNVGPGVRTDAIAVLKGLGPASPDENFDDGHSVDGHQIYPNARIIHVT
jgi:hypothetical protein